MATLRECEGRDDSADLAPREVLQNMIASQTSAGVTIDFSWGGLSLEGRGTAT